MHGHEADTSFFDRGRNMDRQLPDAWKNGHKDVDDNFERQRLVEIPSRIVDYILAQV